jgi:SAM-dependent methyltransferase
MASSTAPDPQQDLHEKIAFYVQSKKYVDEPEILPWYKKDIEEIKPRTRGLLERYSNIPPADVEAHVKKVVSLCVPKLRSLLTLRQRDEAFKIFPYPCLGNWGFLNLNVADAPAYNEVVSRVKNGELYLDIGCCMGQDIRKLVSDGVPAENTYASDLKAEFWDIGYDLFLDGSTLKTKFIQADVFDADSELKQLDGKLDIVLAHSFFHLFDWNDQAKAVKRVIQLLKPEPGVMVFGRQGAMVEAGSFEHANRKEKIYWHNVESWNKLWKQVGEETNSNWEVDATLGDEDMKKRVGLNKTNLLPAGSRFMTFTVRRV